MRFLVSDIGREDAILGYPWLTVFRPKFSWTHGTTNTPHLPIVLHSLNPTKNCDIIARLHAEEKQQIVDTLEQECGV